MDSAGNAYITGGTGSYDFPTVNPYQDGLAEDTNDAFVTKINNLGSALIYSTYLGGNELDGAVEFCVGAIVTPEAQPLEPQLIKFEKKVTAGAEFFQTQAIYDLDNFSRFMEHARKFKVKILAGIVLLSSARMAKYMTANVPGIFVPQDLLDEMSAAPKEEMLAKGIEIAGRTIAALKKDAICDGVHIMAIGREETVPDILAAAGI